MDYTVTTGGDTIGCMGSTRTRGTKPKAKPAAPPSADPAKVTARKADRHLKKLLPARASDELRAVLDAIAESERRSVAQIVEILIEEALKARGHWPPPAKS